MKLVSSDSRRLHFPITSADSLQWMNVHTGIQMLTTKRMPDPSPSAQLQIRSMKSNMKSKRQLFRFCCTKQSHCTNHSATV